MRDRSTEKIYSKIKLRTSSNGSDRRIPMVDLPSSPKDEIAAALQKSGLQPTKMEDELESL